ncbi:cell wall-binding repeat-containing protein [Ornithinicoccus hortensis]|uniref:cell wall-binding repeat-containing protein n=1 Tax=Ornithinicoccus hortensis TaxID=82346 RepID=UPI001297068B
MEFIPDVTPEGDPAPILLVKADAIPSTTAAALAALAPSEIIVIGGTNSVSTGVEDTLGESADVRRIAGANRYETAALIAAEYGEVDTIYVATGQGDISGGLALADALTAASVAGSQTSPVVLTKTDTLPSATAAVITELAPANIVLVGGTGAVSDAVLAQLNALAPTVRVAGTDRYETAVALTADYATDGDILYIASGTSFPDALAGSSPDRFPGRAAAAVQGRPPPVRDRGRDPASVPPGHHHLRRHQRCRCRRRGRPARTAGHHLHRLTR